MSKQVHLRQLETLSISEPSGVCPSTDVPYMCSFSRHCKVALLDLRYMNGARVAEQYCFRRYSSF